MPFLAVHPKYGWQSAWKETIIKIIIEWHHVLAEMPDFVINTRCNFQLKYSKTPVDIMLHSVGYSWQRFKINSAQNNKLTSEAVNRCFGLYLTRPSTSPISTFVVKLGKIFSHSSLTLSGNLLLQLQRMKGNTEMRKQSWKAFHSEMWFKWSQRELSFN